MDNTDLIKKYKGQATYQITVSGMVDPNFMSRLNNLEVAHANSKGAVYSNLTGIIEDQEALMGVIGILINHQHKILSVLKIDA